METLANFDTKQEFENNTTDSYIVAHVIDEKEVYVDINKRPYKFLIHGWFSPTLTTNVRLLSSTSVLNKVGLLLITNLDTLETETIVPTLRMSLPAGNYRVDYGIYMNLNGNYTAKPNLFGDGDHRNDDIIYVLVEPDVIAIGSGFLNTCYNLTGCWFTKEENIDELIQDIDSLFLGLNDSPIVDLNLVKVDSHILGGDGSAEVMSNISSTLSYFLTRCNKVGDIDLSENENIKSLFRPVLGCNDTSVPSTIYLNKNVTGVSTRYQGKILKFEIPEDSTLAWDETVLSVVKRDPYVFSYVDNGETITKEYINIICGGGIFPNKYLHIPPNYIITSYDAFAGRYIDVFNLYDYNAIGKLPNGEIGIYLTGLFDALYTKVFILPKNITFMFPGTYNSGWSLLDKIIIPSSTAPLVSWHNGYGGWYGKSGQEYGYAFPYSGDWGPDAGRNKKNTKGYFENDPLYVANKKLIVLGPDDGSWTSQYDRSTPQMTGKTSSHKGEWEVIDPETGVSSNLRPNVFYDLICVNRNDPSAVILDFKDARYTYWLMDLEFVEDIGLMDSIVNNIITEQINE